MDGTVAAGDSLGGGTAVDGVALDVAAAPPAVVGPAVVGPALLEPVVVEPALPEPVVVEPASAEPVVVDPEAPAAKEPRADSNPAIIGEPGYGGTESGALFDVDMPVRLPSAISPSRAGDFMQCPLLFRLRVVDKVPEPPNAAAARGTLVHAVLDRLFDLPAGGRTPDQAAALLQPEWDRLLAKTPELAELFATPEELTEWLASAKSLIGTYFTLEDPNRLEPAEREWFVRTVVGEGDDRFVMHGIVDRLDVAPNGLLRVVDYKTGKAPPAAYEAKNLFQMKFYALVLWRLRGVEQKITAIWAAIRAAAQRREWPASPSRLCDWCSFKPTCPAHGGEVPPAPQVEFVPAA